MQITLDFKPIKDYVFDGEKEFWTIQTLDAGFDFEGVDSGHLTVYKEWQQYERDGFGFENPTGYFEEFVLDKNPPLLEKGFWRLAYLSKNGSEELTGNEYVIPVERLYTMQNLLTAEKNKYDKIDKFHDEQAVNK